MEVTARAAGLRGACRRPLAADHDAAALAGLHADLVRIARGELFTHHLDVQLAEDLVSEATIRWLGKPLHVQLTQAALRAWFRTTIRRMAVDQVRRPSRDILDLAGVYSLDEPWARGE